MKSIIPTHLSNQAQTRPPQQSGESARQFMNKEFKMAVLTGLLNLVKTIMDAKKAARKEMHQYLAHRNKRLAFVADALRNISNLGGGSASFSI